MKHQKKSHACHSLASALVRRPVSGTIQISLALFIASALTASADNLAALNQLAQIEYGESAAQAYGNIPSIFGVPTSQITALTPSQLQQALNAGIASGQNPYFGKGTSGVNILAGAHPITLGQAAAAQAQYDSDHNAAELLATLYSDAGVNLEKVFGSVLNPIGPASPEPVQSAQVFHNMILDQVKTVDEEQATAAERGAKGTILGLHPMVESSAFFEQSELKGGGGDRELYGVNLSVEGNSDRLKTWATVPVQWVTFASSTYTTYGLDVGAKYELIRNSGLYLGGHVNYLADSGQGAFGDYDWETGPFIGYTYKFSPRFAISTGVLTDYIQPQVADATWLGGFGANFGVRLTDHMALNTYYTYWRNLEANDAFVGYDWHDVGVDFVYTLGKSWRLMVGAKTSLGYAGYNSDYQFHLGAGWQF